MSLRRPQPAHSAPPGSTTPPFRRCQVLHETFRQQKWSWMPSRSCRPRGQPVRVCAASSDAPAQGDARRAPLHAQALRRRESAAAIQARRYAPEKKQACEVRAYGNAAVAAAAATEATCALDIVVTRRCRAHLCVPRGNPEARGGLCQCHHNSLRSPSVMPFRVCDHLLNHLLYRFFVPASFRSLQLMTRACEASWVQRAGVASKIGAVSAVAGKKKRPIPCR